MWTWLPQSLEGWVLLFCLSSASFYVMYEGVLLRLKKPSLEKMVSASNSLSLHPRTGADGSKIISSKKATS